MEITQITRDEAKEIAGDYLLTTGALRKSSPQDKPTIVLIAAQPGSGKTGLATASKDYLNGQGGYVHVDADRLRESLPYYPQLAKEDPQHASGRSQADAGLCVQELRAMAKQERRNIMEEGTYRDPDGVAKFIDGLKESGYRVELRILAVPPEQSRLGVYQRYENQLQGGIPPRDVEDAYHDTTVAGLHRTIERVQGQVDRCTVHTRAGDVLYDSSKAPGDALSAVVKAQAAVTPEAKAQTAAGWGWVYARVLQREGVGQPERQQAVERHLVKAHHDLRADPEASRVYDKASPPIARELSQALASYHQSGAQKVHGVIKDMQGRGLTATSIEQVMSKLQEKLASAGAGAGAGEKKSEAVKAPDRSGGKEPGQR